MNAALPGGDQRSTEAATAAAAAGPPPRSQEKAGGAMGRAARLRTALFRSGRRPGFWAAALLLGLVAGGFVLAFPQLRAWYHYRAARSALQDYHNPQAVRHLQVCLRVWPEDPEVLLLAARAARRARIYADAERCLEKYHQARGVDEASSLEQLLLSAECRVDRVAGLCRHYVEQGHADSPLILEALARGYLREYRLDEARYCLDEWLKRQPDNVQAHCLKAELHLDFEHAMNAAAGSYLHAVELDPDHEEARQGLAVVLLEKKYFAEAVPHLEYVRQRQPDNLRVVVGLAECRRSQGKRAQALKLVGEVLDRDAGFPPALALRGRLAMDDRDYVAAEHWLRQAVTRNPADHRPRYQLMLCLRHNGKVKEAQSEKQQIEQTKKDLKRFDQIVTRDLRQRPHDPALHYALGKLLLRSGYRQEGLRWLHSALRQDSGYLPARQALVRFHRQ